MKLFIMSLFFIFTFGITTPLPTLPKNIIPDSIFQENKYTLSNNVVYWAYASEDQQYTMIYTFIIAGNGGLVLKKTPESNPYDELPKMKNCMDSTYNDVWLEFDHDIQILSVMCGCAARLGWMD